MLHVHAETPLVARVLRPGAPSEHSFHPQGAALDIYLPAGTTELSLRALLGGVLSGNISFTTSPVPELREGLGPEVMLSPGTLRAFRFRVGERTAIGLGARSDSDRVETVLMDGSGKLISSGVVQMTELDKGDYLLGLYTPPDADPARARPVLAGISPPHRGPPAEVIRTYLDPDQAD
jgi:hypothetical protein